MSEHDLPNEFVQLLAHFTSKAEFAQIEILGKLDGKVG